ncbi:MAG: hypothetical protein HGA59_00060 [Chlorobiaceae bacterium]|nr:hypothetical protein [Chlorobiaceae bacterium]NTV16178.1 hypothetical protein [Chlorobiaceae bacterium]
MMHKAEKLSVCWRYHAGHDALIWQLMFTSTGNLIGQKRFAGSRQALFFGIDTATGSIFCDDFLLMDHIHPFSETDNWFTGFETTLGDLVYCHTCKSDSPEHRGIWAVDFMSGRVVWSRPDIVFVANLEDEFLVYKSVVFAGFPERHFLLIDPFTGADIRCLGLDSLEVHAIREAVVQEEVRQQVTLPEVVMEGMPVERAALQRAGIAETNRCECIVQGSLTVAALHEKRQLPDVWDTVLKVWQNDRLVYADCMEECVEKPGRNNFLIRCDHMYYLKGKEELISVALS